MSYKVYSGQFLASHGYPILIVTSPVEAGEKFIAECHSFFSESPETYALSECVYDSEDKDHIDNAVLMQAVKEYGENLLYKYLSEVNSIQYQAMLAGFGYKISEAEENLLLQFHLRNCLSQEIESKIVHNSSDVSLKEYLRLIGRLGRITTQKKI